MKHYVILTVELLFIQGALFIETDEESNSQYWKTRYLSGSDYGSRYNLNHDIPEKRIKDLESHSRVFFSWGSIKNNSQDSRKGNIWWPWSNYEEWASSIRKHNITVNITSTQSPAHVSFRNRSEKKKKKKRRKKKKSRKNKNHNVNSNTQSYSENTQPKINFFISNSISNNTDNYAINRDISSNVRYESSNKPPQEYDSIITPKPVRGDWDNNELDNEIHPQYNYYESIPLMNKKNIVLDKIKKHRNFDIFMKSYSSRNFTSDVNECLTDNGGCEGLCINTPGSYKCHCPDGFKLDMNKCIDINECLLRNGHGPCQDKCINEWGNYKCSCEDIPGTRLAKDGHTCEDIDECKERTAGCSHDCINTIGSAFCICPSGFLLGMDWKTCFDIDECAVPEMQNNKCEKGCENTVGSYICL